MFIFNLSLTTNQIISLKWIQEMTDWPNRLDFRKYGGGIIADFDKGDRPPITPPPGVIAATRRLLGESLATHDGNQFHITDKGRRVLQIIQMEANQFAAALARPVGTADEVVKPVKKKGA